LLPYGLILPAAVLELLIHIIPTGMGVWMAFRGLTQLTIANWTSAPSVGLANFRAGLNPDGPIGSALYSSIARTCYYTVLVVGVSWVFGMFAAVMLNTRFRGRGVLRTIFLIPFALPAYATAIGARFAFSQQTGALNHVLVDQLHLLNSKPFWLIGPNSFWTLVMASIWRTWPFPFLMLLAALQAIPDELYEAARIDGASAWQQFRQVTLPSVRPANAILLLVMGLWTFNEFTMPYTLFGASPPDAARLINPHIYVNSFVNFNFGLGAAMSTLLLILMLIVSLLYVRLALRRVEPDA
jgi:multiple sugar transport system permease protein